MNFIFRAGFLRALWVQRSRHTLRFWRTRRTSPSRRLARKREFHLLRFDQQITHETFAEFSGRVTHTLNNFPIAEIDKTIKVNERALTINNSIKWKEDEVLTKLVFLLSKFERWLLTLQRCPAQKITLWNLEMSPAVTVQLATDWFCLVLVCAVWFNLVEISATFCRLELCGAT